MMEVDQPVVSQADKEAIPNEAAEPAELDTSVASPDIIIQESDDLPALVISDSEGEEQPTAKAEQIQANKAPQSDAEISGVTPLNATVMEVDATDKDDVPKSEETCNVPSKQEQAENEKEMPKPAENAHKVEHNENTSSIYENIDLTGVSSADDSGVSDQGCEPPSKKVQVKVVKIVKDTSHLTAQELLQSLLAPMEDEAEEEAPNVEEKPTQPAKQIAAMESQQDQAKEATTPAGNDPVDNQEPDKNVIMIETSAPDEESSAPSVNAMDTSEDIVCIEKDKEKNKESVSLEKEAEKVTEAEEAVKEQEIVEKIVADDPQASGSTKNSNTADDEEHEDDDDDVVCLLEQMDDLTGSEQDAEEDNAYGNASSGEDSASSQVDGCTAQSKENEIESTMKTTVPVECNETGVDAVEEPPKKRPRSECYNPFEGENAEPLEAPENQKVEPTGSAHHARQDSTKARPDETKTQQCCDVLVIDDDDDDEIGQAPGETVKNIASSVVETCEKRPRDVDESEGLKRTKTEASSSGASPVQEPEVKPANSPEPKPLPMNFMKNFSTHSTSLSDLTRDNLEELVMQKVCEAMMYKAELAEELKRADRMDRSVKALRKRVADIYKQYTDLKSLHEQVLIDLQKKENGHVAPRKITRAVGLQVNIHASLSFQEFRTSVETACGVTNGANKRYMEMPTGANGSTAAGPSGSGRAGPSGSGTAGPSGSGRAGPSGSGRAGPSGSGTAGPSGRSTAGPSGIGTAGPSGSGTASPSGSGTAGPSGSGTAGPSGSGTAGPSGSGTAGPSGNGTAGPSSSGRAGPSGSGNAGPSGSGTAGPSGSGNAGPSVSSTASTSRDQATNSAQQNTNVEQRMGLKHPPPNVIRTSIPVNVTFMHNQTASAVTINPNENRESSPVPSTSSSLPGSTTKSASSSSPNSGRGIGSPSAGPVTARKKTMHKITPKRPPLSADQHEEQEKMARQQQELFLQEMYSQQQIISNAKGENATTKGSQNATSTALQTTTVHIRKVRVASNAPVPPIVAGTAMNNLRTPNNRMGAVANPVQVVTEKQVSSAARPSPQPSGAVSTGLDSLIDLTEEEETPRISTDVGGASSAPSLPARNQQNGRNGMVGQLQTSNSTTMPPELVAAKQMMKLSMAARQQQKQKMTQRILNGNMVAPGTNATAGGQSGTKFGSTQPNSTSTSYRPILPKRPPVHVGGERWHPVTNGLGRPLGTLSVQQAGTKQKASIKPPNYPAPLPLPETYQSQPNWKNPPPKPSIRINNVPTGIVISWSMPDLSDMHADIEKYQIYAYQEAPETQTPDAWRHVGDVNALPLPMAVTLTHFHEGQRYHFAVRAIDKHQRSGFFSDPRTWSEVNTSNQPAN